MLLNRRSAFVPAALVCFAALAGCAKTNPAVGTWSGKTPNGAQATLTLAADGTGTVSIPPVMQSKPITWKSTEDKKVDLSFSPPAGPGQTAPAGGMAAMSMPATIGDDSKTMTLNFPMFALTLNKDEAAK